jgi:hypothetical protein
LEAEAEAAEAEVVSIEGGSQDGSTRRPVVAPKPDPLPASDEAWIDSLYRKPGTSIRRLERWSRAFVGSRQYEPLPSSNVIVRLRLRRPLAADLVVGIEGWHKVVMAAAGRLEYEPNAPGSKIDSMVAVQAGLLWVQRGRTPPMHVGFLALLEHAIRVWDEPKAHVRHAAEKIYRRAGWRCMAPGCTVRCKLEDHHLDHGLGVPRKSALSGRITLCRFHHQMGEHGLYMRCGGKAPYKVWFRLGQADRGVYYVNDRRMSREEALAACK